MAETSTNFSVRTPVTAQQHRLAHLWERLTRPHPSITDIEMRRQSRLLAGGIIAFLLAGNVGIVLLLVQQKPAMIAFTLLVYVIQAISYVLNRRGHYRAGSWLAVLSTFVVMHLGALVTGSLTWLYFGDMVMILGAMFLSLRMTVVLFVASIVLQTIISIVSPLQSTLANASPFIVFLCTGALIMVFTNHRSGLEQERQAELQTANRKLRESEAELEQRVEERTRDLAIAANVSRQITTILDLNQLLNAVVENTKASFSLYYVSVFLFDESTHMLTLEAGSGEVGKLLKAQGKTFSLLTDNGLVPTAARTRQAVIVNDVSKEERHLANPQLPNTCSELSVPMTLGDTLIGVLDFQAQELNRFSTDDASIMTTLADQIAIAVNNAQLYARQIQVAEQLREVDNIKSRFLASMSHELRTPLNAVLNFTKFVATGMLGPINEEQVDALNKTINSGKHLLSLINDVLDITKIESGMLNLFVESEIDLATELESVIATADSLLADKPDVKLLRNIPDTLPLLIGDKRRIRQILLNLVSNACKFTAQGSITISVNVEDETVLMAVKDTGPGISPEEQALLFEPFRQTKVGLSQGGGTGLGLAIAKRLAEAHGGSLWLESTPGSGSCFSVRLPIASETLKAQIVTAPEPA